LVTIAYGQYPGYSSRQPVVAHHFRAGRGAGTLGATSGASCGIAVAVDVVATNSRSTLGVRLATALGEFGTVSNLSRAGCGSVSGEEEIGQSLLAGRIRGTRVAAIGTHHTFIVRGIVSDRAVAFQVVFRTRSVSAAAWLLVTWFVHCGSWLFAQSARNSCGVFGVGHTGDVAGFSARATSAGARLEVRSNPDVTESNVLGGKASGTIGELILEPTFLLDGSDQLLQCCDFVNKLRVILLVHNFSVLACSILGEVSLSICEGRVLILNLGLEMGGGFVCLRGRVLAGATCILAGLGRLLA
jgi:hypothetical protein